MASSAAASAAAIATPVEPAPGLTDAEALDGLEHLHYPSQDAFKPSWLKQLEVSLVETKGEVEKSRNVYSEKTQELYMKDQENMQLKLKIVELELRINGSKETGDAHTKEEVKGTHEKSGTSQTFTFHSYGSNHRCDPISQ